MKKAKADLIRACVLGYQPTAEEIHEAGKHYRTRLRGRVTECDTVLITHRKFKRTAGLRKLPRQQSGKVRRPTSGDGNGGQGRPDASVPGVRG